MRFDISWRRYLLPPLDREGKWFAGGFALVALALYWLHPLLGLGGAVLTVWCFFFFRDPPRMIPDATETPGLLIAPASGVVQMLGNAVPPPELELGDTAVPRLSIFMSVFDCHVNRVPCAGSISKIAYHKGKFLSASDDKASDDNERNSVLLRCSDGRRVAMVQIAGLVARRIRCDLTEGKTVTMGERLGLIRFGSRVDVYLPSGGQFLAIPGQVTVSGETVIADLDGTGAHRTGSLDGGA